MGIACDYHLVGCTAGVHHLLPVFRRQIDYLSDYPAPAPSAYDNIEGSVKKDHNDVNHNKNRVMAQNHDRNHRLYTKNPGYLHENNII